MIKKERSRLSERLSELRKEIKLSQYKLAEELGFSRGLISNYEQGTREPDLNTIKVFANFFNVSIDYLLGITDIRLPAEELIKKGTIKIEDPSTIEKISKELPDKERDELENFAKYLHTKSKLTDSGKESSATLEITEERKAN